MLIAPGMVQSALANARRALRQKFDERRNFIRAKGIREEIGIHPPRMG